MLQVHDGTRQLALYFQQAKETHAWQLRVILQKLTLRGLLAPESASYISSLPPATPMRTVNPGFTGHSMGLGSVSGGASGLGVYGPTGTLGGGGSLPHGSAATSAAAPHASAALSTQPDRRGTHGICGGVLAGPLAADLSALAGGLPLGFSGSALGRLPPSLAGGPSGTPTVGSMSHDGLQAQLDALEAGLFAPLSSHSPNDGQSHSPNDSGSAGGANSENLHGEDALNLFAAGGE
jgi:hypothetical protein